MWQIEHGPELILLNISIQVMQFESSQPLRSGGFFKLLTSAIKELIFSVSSIITGVSLITRGVS
jgi:hypothetical protein